MWVCLILITKNEHRVKKLANELIVLLRRTSQKNCFYRHVQLRCLLLCICTQFSHMKCNVLLSGLVSYNFYLFMFSLSAVNYLSFLILRRKNEEKKSIYYYFLFVDWKRMTFRVAHTLYLFTQPLLESIWILSHLWDQVVRFVSKRQQNDKSPKRGRPNWAIRKRK